MELHPPKSEQETPAQDQAPQICLRCHQVRPLDDDGFCDACRRALEEACL